jgi:hypothetical protein
VLIVDYFNYGNTASTECQCSTLETLWQATITKSLGCFAKASFCMETTISLRSTRIVPYYDSTCGRLWTTLLTIPHPRPVSWISWTHHADTSWLQTLDISFFCPRI